MALLRAAPEVQNVVRKWEAPFFPSANFATVAKFAVEKETKAFFYLHFAPPVLPLRGILLREIDFYKESPVSICNLSDFLSSILIKETNLPTCYTLT